MKRIRKFACALALTVGVCPVPLSGFGNPLKNFDKALTICAVGIAAGGVVGGCILTKAWRWAFYASGPKRYTGATILGMTVVGAVFGAGYFAAQKLQKPDARD